MCDQMKNQTQYLGVIYHLCHQRAVPCSSAEVLGVCPEGQHTTNTCQPCDYSYLVSILILLSVKGLQGNLCLRGFIWDQSTDFSSHELVDAIAHVLVPVLSLYVLLWLEYSWSVLDAAHCRAHPCRDEHSWLVLA